ncbi:carbohydrate ABC transporter permease [Humibacter ginsenosidimutans]|uniref:Carbohydrate ABC transporter permease n=1 Tax=Humibacter ginsenosidimutans TaxID=2599293 RepID=A0A5B8M2T0_9MICO|nr:carbohydrate ABC transporter permease [Humibacter ginsenosidimutans]QDZ14461.1 carbohydrate ABC transporter permease [Humibacter ginsenosidimutans]
MSTTTIRTGKRGRATANIAVLVPVWVRAIVIAVILIVIALPLMFVVFGSVNSDLGVASGEYFPSSFTLANYVKIWSTVGLANGMFNSIVVAGSTAVVATVIAVATAYVLVRFTFLGRVTILRSLLILQSIPGTLLLLPLFVVFSSFSTYIGVQVIGTRWGLFITYLTFALPFATWVMVTYLRGLPPELEEAARMDGASNLRIIAQVILPLSWPGIVVAGIFSFLQGWNDVLFASVMTNTDTQTVSIALNLFSASQSGGSLPLYGQLMAASLICAAPVVVLYLCLQRWLVGGLTAGSVK